MLRKLPFKLRPAAAFPPTREGQSITIVKCMTASLGGQALFVALQGLTMACAASLLLLLRSGNPYGAEGACVAAHITIQTQRQLMGIAAIGLNPLSVLIPIARAHDIANNSHGAQSPLERIAKGSCFVASVDLPGQRQLLLHPLKKLLRAESLRGLGRLTVG